MATQHHTKEFFDLIRSIGETKSKQEEDKLIIREIATLKSHMANTKVTLKLMKEYIVRLLYCEMLGHDASFGYIHAIKLTSSKNVLEKRVGYLAVTLCLPKNHELILLIIANLQRDLKSTNYLEVAAALSATSKIVNEETIPALLPQVAELRKHHQAIVRKKTIMLLHTFHTISPGSVPQLLDYGKEALCDRDPAVMGASLNIFEDLCKDEDFRASLKELATSFVNILKQVIEHRLSREYDYHRLPAPWLQIKLLKIIGFLGKDDKLTSELMYDVLREVIQRADNGLNIGHAVVFECIKAITSIYQNPILLETAAGAVSRFITSSNHNLKYLGINALTSIVKINPNYATQHQMVVIDCLEDPDETLKRVTLSLLFTMTNPGNVVVIVKKLLTFTKKAVDDHMRAELIKRIAYLAEHFAPDARWYIDTMSQLFELGPEFIPQSAVQNMLTVIAEGSGEDAENDQQIRVYCVDTFYNMLDEKVVLHDLHVQMIAWILGEYGYLTDKRSQDEIIDKLCEVAERQLEDDETRCWIVTAISKLIAQIGSCPPAAEDLIQKYKNSKNVDLQQRCYELHEMVGQITIMDQVLPLDGSCEEIEVDDELAFLNEFVQQARMMGARDYVAEEMDRSKLDNVKFERRLLTDAYEAPQAGRKTIHPIFTGAAEMMPSMGSAPTAPVGVYTSNTEGLTALSGKSKNWFEDDSAEVSLPNSGTSMFQQQQQQPQPTPIPAAKLPTLPTQPVSSFQPAAPEPVQQKQLTKGQKQLMSGLFGASSQPAKTGAAPAKKRRPSKGSKQPPAPLPEMEWQPPAAQTATAPAPMIDFGEPEVPVPVKAAPQTAYQSPSAQAAPPQLISFEEEFFGTPSSSQQAPAPATQQPLFDPFDPFAPIQTSPTNSASKGTGLEAFNLSYRPGSLSSKLSARGTKLATVTLSKDQFLNVTSTKFLKDDGLVVLLQFNTDRGFTLTNINCNLQPPGGFAVAEIEPEAPQTPSIKGTAITISKLEPAQPISLAVHLNLSAPVFGTNLLGTISYVDNQKQSKLCTISMNLEASDVVRPLTTCKTEDFKGLWGSHTHEKRVQIKASFGSLPAFCEKLKSMNVHQVQIIDNEVIGAARVVGINMNLLIHSKVAMGSVVFTVRTKDTALATAICTMATKVFTSQ